MITVNEVTDNFHLFTIQELLELQEKLYKYIASKATQETIDLDDWAKDDSGLDPELYPNNEAGAFDELDNHEMYSDVEEWERAKKKSSDYRRFQEPTIEINDDEYNQLLG